MRNASVLALIGFLIFAVLGAQSLRSAAASSSIRVFEYRTTSVIIGTDMSIANDFVPRLNILGKDGWEVIYFAPPTGANPIAFVLLKRQR